MRFLGIDPGSAVTGFGIINSERPLHFECVSFGVVRSNPKWPMNQRLKHIYDNIYALVDQHAIDHVALEDVFFGKNIQAAFKLGQARAAAVLAAVNAEKSVATYSPREVKQALTGFGAASKEQVQKMVMHQLSLSNPVTPLDASDALAICLCHINRWWTENRNLI